MKRGDADLSTLIKLLEDSRGATSIEYGLILVLIAVGLVAGFGILGDHLASSYQDITADIETATGLD
jgi:Flp pilus assembly pilin Flp